MIIHLFRLHLLAIFCCCLIVLFPFTGSAQSGANTNKLYVDISVTAPGDGSSWNQALKQLSDALAAAAANPDIDSILVAMGAYTPVGGSGIVNRDSAFLIRPSGGLSIIGGYPSGGGNKSYDLYPTILSGEIGVNNADDNSYHVLVIAGIDPGADSIVIDNFIIRDAWADGIVHHDYNGVSIPSRDGGGVFIHNTDKVSIRDCTIQDHGVLGWGGALYNHQSSPEIIRCTFFRNSSFGRAGAVANVQSGPLITKCLFNENMAMDGGGAIYNTQNSNARIVSCEIYKSMTAGSGTSGAVFNENSSPEITGCRIAGNQTTANVGGAGVYNANATVRIINTYITGNYAATNGGGAALSNGANSNCIVTNCSIYGNIGVNASGSIRNDASQLSFTNTILTGTNVGIVAINGAVTTVNYSLIFDWTGGGAGNLDGSLDPLFHSPPWVGTGSTWITGIYSLKPCSPCINTGTPDTTGLNLPDSVNGMRRIQHGRIDMGVDENISLGDGFGTVPITKTIATADLVNGHETMYGNNCTELIAAITPMPGNLATGESSVMVDFDHTLSPDYVSRYYEITVANNPAAGVARVTLFFTQAEFDAYNAANGSSGRFLLPHFDSSPHMADVTNIRVRKVSGATETILMPELLNYDGVRGRWALIFMVSGFSEFYLFTASDPALPLKLTSFDAKIENCTAGISWTTAEEFAVSHFELEHSNEGRKWSVLSTVDARNTAGEHNYSLMAELSSTENFYRLKMVDIDGSTTYSRVLKLNAPLNCILKQIRLYPNPVSDILYIQRVATGDLYSIYDNSGKIILQGTVTRSIQEIDIRKLFTGIYSIAITNKNGKTKLLKFLKR